MTLSESDPRFGLDEDLSHLDIAVVHDPIRTMNGGIDVIANIARFLDAPIYTLYQTKRPDPVRDLDVKPILDRPPATHRLLHRAGMGRLLELSKRLRYQNWEPPHDADVIVTTGTRSQQVIHHPEQHRLHFFNTPERWLWDLSHGQWADRPAPVESALLAYANHVRNTDVTSTHRADRLLANSDLVAERVAAYYDRDATVAYCPVDTFALDPDSDGTPAADGYYLMINRLVPEKRVELVVEAFNDLGLPLKVAGTPSETSEAYADRCRRMADDHVEFVGWVEGEEKRDLIAHCRALVFAGEHEDFGMPPVEAMAAGKPVVGVDEGFTKYQIDDGETGVLFDPDERSLVEAVERAESSTWDDDRIRERSRAFDTRVVRRVWQDTLRDVLDGE